MAKTVRIAFIGAGGRATSSHYPSLYDMDEVDIVAACDVNQTRLDEACSKFRIQGRYNDYRKMLAQEKPDAVYAIMPPQNLYDISAEVIESGSHLFVEKPPAVTTEQTRQLHLLAQQHDVLTGVTFQRRFSPLIRKGKNLCIERGPVHTAHASFYKNSVGSKPYYKGGMDVLTVDGIHAIDTLRYLCGGEVERVSSDSRRLDATHWNMHLAIIKFSSGATGILLNNFMAGKRIFSVEIHSPGISFFGDPEEGGKLFAENKPEAIQTIDPFELAGSKEDYRAFGAFDINQHFVDCIKNGVLPETHFGDALKTMELVDAIYHSQL